MRCSNLILILVLITAACLSVLAQSECTGNAIFTSQFCAGDAVSTEELELFKAVNEYRHSNGLAPLRLSPPLSRLGNRRMLDLDQNMKSITHSWSNCRYDINDESTWPCLIASPTRLNVGYTGNGYETLYRTTGKAEPTTALAAWKKSSLHSSIILNKDKFANMPWEEIGVAIDGQYACLWFGYRPVQTGQIPTASGAAVSLDQAISGLSRTLTISRLPEQIIWRAASSDGKLKVTVSGSRSDVSEAEIFVSTNALSAEHVAVMSALLKNIFRDWADIDDWLAGSIKMLSESPKGWRRKIIQNRVAEIRGEGIDGVRLTIKPYEKPKAIEME
jgi:hypothetical protein